MKTKTPITSASKIGPRGDQEDYYLAMRVPGNNFKAWLLAVMDGHLGKSAAELCHREIPNLFKWQGLRRTEAALADLVKNIDAETRNFSSGSTLSIALVVEKPRRFSRVSVAVLGDSPIVVLDRQNNIYIAPEHNVRTNPQERAAAEKRGGKYFNGYMFGQDSATGLQLSRALGDAYLEKILSREPDIHTIFNPQWILVASDGIFDPNHEYTSQLLEQICSLAHRPATAGTIMSWAERRGLRDNATAVAWKMSD